MAIAVEVTTDNLVDGLGSVLLSARPCGTVMVSRTSCGKIFFVAPTPCIPASCVFPFMLHTAARHRMPWHADPGTLETYNCKRFSVADLTNVIEDIMLFSADQISGPEQRVKIIFEDDDALRFVVPMDRYPDVGTTHRSRIVWPVRVNARLQRCSTVSLRRDAADFGFAHIMGFAWEDYPSPSMPVTRPAYGRETADDGLEAIIDSWDPQ